MPAITDYEAACRDLKARCTQPGSSQESRQKAWQALQHAKALAGEVSMWFLKEDHENLFDKLMKEVVP